MGLPKTINRVGVTVKNQSHGSAEPIIGNNRSIVEFSAGWSVIYRAPDSTENVQRNKRHFPTYCLPGESRGGFFDNERAVSSVWACVCGGMGRVQE